MRRLGDLLLWVVLGIGQLFFGVAIILIFVAAVASVLANPVIVVFLGLCLLLFLGAFVHDEYVKWRRKKDV